MATFTGKRGLHVVANVGVVEPRFTGKRGLHVVANVGVVMPSTVMHYKGNWNLDTVYMTGDMVLFETSPGHEVFFICLGDNTIVRPGDDATINGTFGTYWYREY